MEGMRKKTRQYIRKAERAGVVIEETDDLERAHRVLRIVGERDRFAVHSLDHLARLRAGFGDRFHVLMARIGPEDVGTLMLVRMAERAWELYGGWSGTHAEDRPFYLLKWRAIQRMRQLGVARYDMWGLAETDDPGNPMRGVTEFKLGFGGDVVEWIGALETPVMRWLYPAWQLLGRRRLARAAALAHEGGFAPHRPPALVGCGRRPAAGVGCGGGALAGRPRPAVERVGADPRTAGLARRVRADRRPTARGAGAVARRAAPRPVRLRAARADRRIAR
jgi:lipid II:glycine glycyltransferase (peptidoglycan interpeptide bridge formation enzyme)